MDSLVPPPARLNEMAFAEHIGFQFRSAPKGTSLVTLKVMPYHLNTQGSGHGGIIPILIDAAGTSSILSILPDVNVISADLRANFIGKLTMSENVEAVGTVSFVGKSTGYSSVVVKNQSGETIALGQVTCVIRQRE